MKLLLDTHVLLWWLDDPAKLTSQAHQAISDPNNEVLVSSAVIWELVIKSMTGKLTIPRDLEEVIKRSRFEHLGISYNHVLSVLSLPSIHRDPFDRMLVSQALLEQATLVTRDQQLMQYVSACIKA